MELQPDFQTVQPVVKKRGRIPWQITKRLIKKAKKLRATPAADLVTRSDSDTVTKNTTPTKGDRTTTPNVTVRNTALRSDKKPNRRRRKHPVRRKRSFYRRTEPQPSLVGFCHQPGESPLLVERSKGHIDVQSMGSDVSNPIFETQAGVVLATKPHCYSYRPPGKKRQRSKRFVEMNRRSFVKGQIGDLQKKHLMKSLDNSTPYQLPTLPSIISKAAPTLCQQGGSNYGECFRPPLPPAQAIGSPADAHLTLHVTQSSDLRMTSSYPNDSEMRPDLIHPCSSTLNSPCHTYPHLISSGLTSRSYPHNSKPLESIGQFCPSSSYQPNSESTLTMSLKPMSEISLPISNAGHFSYCTHPRPTVSPAKSSPPRPTRQLTISSFLSPKKNQDNPVLGESGDRAISLLGPPPLSLVSASLREAPGCRGIPPFFQSVEEQVPLQASYATPMPASSSHKSVFSRLDSPTKYRQTSLQFSRVPPRKSTDGSTYTGRSQRIDGNHLGNLGMYGCGNQPKSGLPSCNGSSLTSILGNHPSLHDNIDLPHDGLRQERSCTRANPENILMQGQNFTQSRLNSDQLVMIKPDVKLKPDDSSCLYQSRSCTGLNMTKLLNRLTSKSCGTCHSASHSSTSYAHLAPPNSCNKTSIITQDRRVEVMDSVLPVQMSGSNTPAVHSLMPSDIMHESASGSRASHAGCVRYIQDSSQVHIPLSQLGLKVIAIDCEMVGCIDLAQRPPEQVLASKMLRFGGGEGMQCTKKDDIGGVLMKTKMKPVAAGKKSKKKPNKELSIAARCSIIGYDDSVLYDKYINPSIGTSYKIINFRTPWSGIAPRHMNGAVPFHVARNEILDIISDCIVVGHNIGSDFSSLLIQNFPASQIRDTSFNQNLKKRAGLPSNNQPGALKKMALALLGRRIQRRSRVGHCSVEDATATMDLYRLEEIEWEDGHGQQ